MSSQLLAGVSALVPFAVILLLTLYDARARSEAPARRAETPPRPLPSTTGRLCIVSARARCVCGRPFEAHGAHEAARASGADGCAGFAYAGGLVPNAPTGVITIASAHPLAASGDHDRRPQPARDDPKAGAASRPAASRSKARAAVVAVALAVVALGATPGVAAAGGVQIYFVQPGDSLSAIADDVGTTVEAIVELNQLADPDHVRHGMALVLPVAGEAAPSVGAVSAPPAAARTYRVEAGDTLSDIAAQFETDTATIARLNGVVDEDDIRVGMALTVPGAAAAPRAAPGASHLVQLGETASEIASRYGITVAALARANGLDDDDVIRAGSALVIPARALPLPPLSVASAVRESAAANGLDPYLVLGLAYLESGWQMDVVSSTGARGVMQLMPDAASWATTYLIGRPMNWRSSLVDNVRVGTAHLEHLLTLADGDAETALAAYYQGWYSVRTIGLFDDTEQYVDDVLALAERFRSRHVLG